MGARVVSGTWRLISFVERLYMERKRRDQGARCLGRDGRRFYHEFRNAVDGKTRSLWYVISARGRSNSAFGGEATMTIRTSLELCLMALVASRSASGAD